MTKEEALTIAQVHIERINEFEPLHPDYEYVVSEPYEYEEYWYFDHQFRPKPDVIVDPNARFAGPPGYVISKQTGEVKTIAWWQLHELGESDKELKRVVLISNELTSEAGMYSKLKQAFKLTSVGALALKRRLEGPQLSEADRKWVLLQELRKQKKDK
jgi:hypothetical protein